MTLVCEFKNQFQQYLKISIRLDQIIGDDGNKSTETLLVVTITFMFLVRVYQGLRWLQFPEETPLQVSAHSTTYSTTYSTTFKVERNGKNGILSSFV